MSVNEKVLDAIQLLATSSVEKAGYDKTIQAQIVSCEDATIGKYRCRYQDATFYAYASNSDVTFGNNAYVYVLVPGNDFKQEKTILGTTQKLGINYISQAEGDQAYDLIGTNCIAESGTYYLNTNNKNYKYTIYSYDGTNNGINLDITALEQYLKESSSSSLIAGATFKTSISAERQMRGHYGIIYNLRFKDNATGQEVVRSYILDEDNMIDNPYRLFYPTRQYQIFEIDGANFIRVESIEIFNSDFPGATGTKASGVLTSGDIQITKLEIVGAKKMSESEINGIAISFYTPQGTFFTVSSPAKEEKSIVAQVRVKGKLVSAAQRIPFYWGRENVSVTPSSELYNKQLGRGWECLNEKNNIKDGTETSDPVVEWVPGKDTFIISKEDAVAKDNKFKVAIIYDDTVVTKQINIRNLSAVAAQLTIESDGGNQFYYDIGHPTLTCYAKANGTIIANCTYHWAYQSDTGVLTELPQTTTQNRNYSTAVTNLNALKNAIEAGTKFANKEHDNLINLETAVNAYNFVQRVEGNKIYDVQIRNITNVGIFKCSVYNSSGIYLGTASITLTNSLNGEGAYSLVINNGSQTFQYDENGTSPSSKSLVNPQKIQNLTFTLYDNLGNPIDNNVILNSSETAIKWLFPIKNTLLVDKNPDGSSAGPDATQEYMRYNNVETLVYDIAQEYDISKRKNQIKLTINYKNLNLTAQTDFSFVKQGQPGTNGTEYSVKIVPNTRGQNPPMWPMVSRRGSNYYINYGVNSIGDQATLPIGSGNGQILFKAQLWRGGERVWKGNEANTSDEDRGVVPITVHWEMLKGPHDESDFEFSNAARGFIYYKGDHLQNNFTKTVANIVKCSITLRGQDANDETRDTRNKTYYGTIPIITAWTNSNDYKVSLKDYTGFRYVLYTSDGTSPQFDTQPFEFVCEKKISNVWEDVSTVNGAQAITYYPDSNGNVGTKIGTSVVYRDEVLLELKNEQWRRDSLGLLKNQFKYQPANRYNGECVNAAVICEYRTGTAPNETTVAKIHVPIHFLLNRYGLAHINAWDGNSVQVNEQDGYILAPQMGAGTKDNNNNFTGVLMGQVKVAGKEKPDNGLLGYAEGERTFFLNSANGSGIFGKSGNGQIIIDPQNEKALLYSSTYWKEIDPLTGLPTSYQDRNVNDVPSASKPNGMLIDLTTPQIKFGNGNFSVTKDGYLTAKGGGSIAGWKIADYTLTAADSSLTLQSAQLQDPTKPFNRNTNPVVAPSKVFSNTHNVLTSVNEGFYLSQDGLSIGSLFKVTNTGIVTVGRGAVNGSSTKHWTINAASDNNDNSYISYKETEFHEASSVESTYRSVYLGTDGFSLGKNFSIDDLGNVKIYRGSIVMGSRWFKKQRTDSNGNPLYWVVTENDDPNSPDYGDTIVSETETTTTNTGYPAKEQQETLNHLFYVDTVQNKLEINIWDGMIDLGRGKFSVSNQGFLKATAGQIGGFKITDDHLSYRTDAHGITNGKFSGSVYLGREGITLGRGFSVDVNGNTRIEKGSISIGSHNEYNPETGQYDKIVNNFGVEENGYLYAIRAQIAGLWFTDGSIWGGTRSGESSGQLTSGFRFDSNSLQSEFGPDYNRFRILGKSMWAPEGTVEGINLKNPDPADVEGGLGFRLEPGQGFGHFKYMDITTNTSIGGSIKGVSNLRILGMDQITPNQTWWIRSSDGQANFKHLYADKHGRINTYGGINGYANENFAYNSTTPTFWISASTGEASFSTISLHGDIKTTGYIKGFQSYSAQNGYTNQQYDINPSTGTATFQYVNSHGKIKTGGGIGGYTDYTDFNDNSQTWWIRNSDGHGQFNSINVANSITIAGEPINTTAVFG